MYYDRKGNTISSPEEWTKLFGDPKYRQIKATTLPDGTIISTVWLGMEHGASPNGPLIFETMVKRPASNNDSDWEEQYRYATEEEASTHHDHLVDLEYHANSYGRNTRWNQIGDDLE